MPHREMLPEFDLCYSAPQVASNFEDMEAETDVSKINWRRQKVPSTLN